MTEPTGTEKGSKDRGPGGARRGWSERFVAAVDRLSEVLGRGVAWLAFLMILIGAFNAVARYLGRYIGVNLSSNAYLELQWYLFSLIFLLGASYTLSRDAHVRVDVIYGRLSARAQAWINLFGSIFFLLPFSIFGLVISWPSVRNSWHVLEGSPDPGGLPRYPIKTVILVAFALLILQGIAEVIKAWRIVRSREGGGSITLQAAPPQMEPKVRI